MQLDQARTYLTRVVPWVPGAYVNLHWTVPNKKFDPSRPANHHDNKKQFLNGRAFSDVEAFLSQLQYILGRTDTLDIYACMSAQQVAEQKQFGTGRPYLAAKRSTDLVAGIRSLYIDLDVKPDGYATTAAALSEMRRFIAEVGLPVPTLVVSSGTGGAHVYWTLDKTLTVAEWQPLANALAEATRRHGLKVDTACTVDAARLLRVPQTWNRKGPQPLPVTMGTRVQPGDVALDDVRRILLPYMGARVVQLPTASARIKATGPGSELAAGIVAPTAPPIDIDTIKGTCGFVGKALVDGGKGNDQPLWNLSTLLATFTQSTRGDGRWAAHEMAKGHPGYAAPDTDALYDRKVAEKEARNLGWPSCAAIENAGCGDCAACPLRHLNKSSLSFGQPISAVVAPGPGSTTPANVPAGGNVPGVALPAGYVFRPSGIIARAVVQDDNSVKLVDVCPYPMFAPWLQQSPWILHFQCRLGGGYEVQISIALANLNSREYMKHLAAQGLVVNRHAAPLLQDFLMSWTTQLQSIRNAVISSAPFGWSTCNNAIDGFVFDGKVWGAGPEKPAASPSPVIAEQYRPRGDLAPWKAAAQFITDQHRPALDAILAAGFGAPLMRFTGQSGSVMSAWSSSSGIGKSTVMQVAQAIWGDPVRGMNSLSDTHLSVINKAGQLRSLPLLWDELKGDDQKEAFVKLAFQISGGKEKSRLNSDATQRDPGTWQTMVVAASNDSLMDTIHRRLSSTEAGILRVFEYKVPDPPAGTMNTGVVSRLIARCHDNHGQAGLEYAKFLGANHKRCADEVARVQDQLTTKLRAPNDERFWIATMACLICGARYANELGLTRIDVQTLTRFLFDTIKELRLLRGAATVDIQKPQVLSSVLAQFLSDMAVKHTLTTDYVPGHRGRPRPCVPQGDHGRLDAVWVRHGITDRVIQISQPVFYDWLGKRNYNAYTFMENLKKAFPGGVKSSEMRSLSAGVDQFKSAGFRGYCVVIEYAGSGFKQILDQVEEENAQSSVLDEVK